jgi:hypothetical protein
MTVGNGMSGSNVSSVKRPPTKVNSDDGKGGKVEAYANRFNGAEINPLPRCGDEITCGSGDVDDLPKDLLPFPTTVRVSERSTQKSYLYLSTKPVTPLVFVS